MNSQFTHIIVNFDLGLEQSVYVKPYWEQNLKEWKIFCKTLRQAKVRAHRQTDIICEAKKKFKNGEEEESEFSPTRRWFLLLLPQFFQGGKAIYGRAFFVLWIPGLSYKKVKERRRRSTQEKRGKERGRRERDLLTQFKREVFVCVSLSSRLNAMEQSTTASV